MPPLTTGAQPGPRRLTPAVTTTLNPTPVNHPNQTGGRGRADARARTSLAPQRQHLPLPLALALGSLLVGATGPAAIAQALTPNAGSEPGAGAVAAEPAAATPSTPSPWAGTVELYGFLPIRTTGSTTVRGFSADTDVWLGQLIPLIQMTASARGSLENGRIGLLADLSYNRIGDDIARTTPGGRLSGAASVTTNFGIYDLALRYRLGSRESAVAAPGSWSVIPYAGVRLVDVNLAVDAELRGQGPHRLRLQRQGELSRTWGQPLLGTQASLFLSERLRVFGRADIGGFGLAGSRDLSGNTQLGLGYAVGNNTDLNLSWRFMGLAFENGASQPSGFTNNQNGVEIGLKVFF